MFKREELCRLEAGCTSGAVASGSARFPAMQFPASLVCLLLVAVPVRAQSNYSPGAPASEDIVEISPFTVSSDSEPAYKGAASYGRVPTPVLDPRTSGLTPGAPVTLLKRADAVAVQFVLSHNGDKQEARNQDLYSSVSSLEAAMKRISGVQIEQREVHFTGGDRRLFSISRGGATSSFVSLLVLADLPEGTRVADRVKQIRDVLGSTKLVGQTKYSDGSVGLYLKNPDQYRREILQRIFDDVQFMKKGFGDEFEILPTGLTGKVRMRVAAEAEIELWIDYGFSFRSIRELEAGKKK